MPHLLASRFAQFEAEDVKRKDAIEVRNQAESIIHDTEKNMADFKDQLSSDDVRCIASSRGP